MAPVGPGQKTFDDATTTAMLAAFDTCQSEFAAAKSAVDVAHSSLMATWGGDAANAYSGSMLRWQEGFQQIRTQLDALTDSMNQYRGFTTGAESGNTTTGGGWAHG